MQKISKRTVEALSPGSILADSEVKGFVARRLGSGKISYGLRYRDKATGKQRWLALGLHGTITADQAREAAKAHAGDVAKAKDPAAERQAAREALALANKVAVNTVDAVLDDFEKRYSAKKKSGDQSKSVLKRHVRPRIGSKSIYELTRRNISDMLDAIEDGSGPVAADRTLAHLRKAFNWQMVRDEAFVSPIIKGMARTAPKSRSRERTLTDQEIRDLWAALDDEETPEAFRYIVRELLLTAQRRTEVSAMHDREIKGDLWTIPKERSKNNREHVVPLTPQARRWIGNRQGFLFSTTDGKKPFTGYSKAKRTLDAAIARRRKEAGEPPMPNWTLHDLRRTARSLMSRAGVEPDIAERVLNHTISGVRGVYDRHEFLDEKRDALTKLADLVTKIVEGR